MKFYGLCILIENSYANDTTNIRSHLKKLKKSFQFPFGIRRFQSLKLAFQPTIDEIRKIIELLKENIERYIFFYLLLIYY